MSALLLSLILTQAADAATTCHALHRGLVESNPVLGSGASCGRVIAFKALTVAPLIVVAPRLAKTHPKWAGALVIVPTSSAGVAVMLNLRTLQR